MKTDGTSRKWTWFQSKSFGLLAAGLMALGVASPATAQNEGLPPWLDVVVVQVKNGQQDEFEDLLKQFMGARQAAGQPTGQVFQVALGHPNEYHLVVPAQSIAANETLSPPMAETDVAIWQRRIQDTVDHVHFFYAATYPDHGVQAPANSPQPDMILLRKISVAQGKEAEYEEWVANEYMPAFRQTNPLGHTMSRGVYGDSLQNYYHAYPLAGWGDLDEPDPMMEVLGQRRYDQMFDAIDDIVIGHEMVVARVRPDLMAQ